LAESALWAVVICRFTFSAIFRNASSEKSQISETAPVPETKVRLAADPLLSGVPYKATVSAWYP